MNKLICSIRRNAFFGNIELGNPFRTTVASGVWGRNMSVSVADTRMVTMRVTTESNNLFRIDVLQVSLIQLPHALPCGEPFLSWIAGSLTLESELGDVPAAPVL